MSENIVEAVLFDIGGVIVTDGPNMERVTTTLGLEPTPVNVKRVDQAVWGVRDAYDLGLSDTQYWTQVAAAAGAEVPSPETVVELTEADIERWASPRTDTVALMAALDAAGTRVGVLSNAPHALARSFAGQAWTQILSARVFSCELGIAKPAPEIFQAALAQLDLDAPRVGFFDDRPSNVAGATRLGMRSELWHDVASAKPVLADWGVNFS